MSDQILEVKSRENKFHFMSTRTAPDLIKEVFSDNYHILDAIQKGILTIRPGDVIVDAGACEGMFSIMLSNMFPVARILAIEPVPQTFHILTRNIELNGCKNIEALNVGIGKPFERKITMITNKDGQSGGSTAYCTFNTEAHDKVEVALIPLDSVFELQNIGRIRLLKMDIEGAEYDALYSCRNLNRVDFFCGEFHMNTKIEFMSRRMDGLANWIAKQTKVIFIEPCKMAE